ncbi:protein involved in polysaccharide export with SLBB domain [Haloferula luteola]|uniref:Protein involved in polysaccharide export with SLBB domain n=1 Tax=Haloferula luteola TaxID=595692 RepID=A0A840UYL5_9BACT|nr:polysaccharide biosynthesis/export family protein [Haloferula luteola]MBB5350872.1 protein involved in polysaccharide export with SLBB domain [Haloferula luteola]
MPRLGCLLLLLSILLTGSLPAQDSQGVPGNQADTSSWRERYELGAGDVINFSLFGRPELDRPGFRIAPDGTISYLQAQNVNVAGLTIDEARIEIEKALGGHFKSPRVIITPQEVGSKRFTILGKVLQKGVVTLERPITLVEAVANAGGIETGLFERKTVELADYDRSFISRRGEHLPVDFRKLFQDGDMTQNIQLEPNDFIFIASTISNDYYVLGAVNAPGVQGMTNDASVVAAISRRGGFTDRAWTDRVLVIRGSFTEPETHVVSLRDILAAKTVDFKILPKDIIYVADRPWAEAEDILKLALSAFATSAASTWVNVNVDPILTDP